MTCPVCTAALEYAPNGAHARCGRCDRIYALPALDEVKVPVGVDPAEHGETLGFPAAAAPMPVDPMTATKNAFAARAAEKAKAGVRVKFGGVAVDVGSGGVGVNTDRLEKDLKKKAGDTVSGWIWGCVGSVVIGGLVLLGFVVIGGIVTWQVMAPGGSSGGGASETAAWDGKAPFSCGGNDNVTLSGASAALPGQIAITAGGNCELTLEGVDVSGGTALSVAGNATVTVNGGRLAGTDAAVSASANATVTGSGVKVEGEVKKKGGAKVSGF